MNIFEDLEKKKKKIGMLLDIISGCDNQGKPIEMDIKERKYRREIYNKAERLGIKAFDINEYSEKDKKFMQKCIEQFNEISNK